MSRSKGARMLNYIGDDAAAENMQQKHDPACAHDLFVSTSRFVGAFLAACDRFTAAVRTNATLQGTVYLHAAKLVVPFD